MPWNVIPIDDFIHVVPVDDIENHTTELAWVGLMHMFTCKCKPRLEFEKDKIIIIHSSFDGREGLEWANELLKTIQ